ncbi:hypothetical protein SAMN05216189_101229 [Pseudomonas delhiensis]|uniref:Uncharacterized protein n=1 Tax=Pseudomonas delhiensis TaxID=366289 RepID=A0A239MDN8_9PSED|nr:hypothetical protein [Pseudomonas delhiensis]SDJ05897.1 hypothetical protein SAMN05216189_101229 [Pseudomonas delhiensis]SNT39949.1 hypothetical protein SAMN06295949_12529 [Pseudomonas delhiensis]
MKRSHLFAGSALLSLGLLAGMAATWLSYRSASEFDGRYHSSGQLVLADGRSLRLEHSLLLRDGHFYAVTRQGDTVQKTSGSVESGFLGHLRLRVEKSELAELQQAAQLDNELLFNLLYGSENDSLLNLQPHGDCLLAEETRQLYCAERFAGEP